MELATDTTTSFADPLPQHSTTAERDAYLEEGARRALLGFGMSDWIGRDEVVWGKVKSFKRVD